MNSLHPGFKNSVMTFLHMAAHPRGTLTKDGSRHSVSGEKSAQICPDSGISAAKYLKEIIIRQTAPDTVVIPRSSQDILCRYLYANMSERNLGILLCLFTGMRVGEICALKWEDFSFQEKSIHVHNTMQRLQIPDSTTAQKTRIMVTSPKSKCSIRTIPIPDSLIQLIQKEFPNRQGYVLAAVNEKYIEPRTMQKYFHYVQKQCGWFL